MGCGASKDGADVKSNKVQAEGSKETGGGQKSASRKLYKNVMQHIPLLSGLTDNELSRLADGMSSKTFQPGAYLMKEGDIGKEFFIVVKGKCEVSRQNRDTGKEEVLANLENRDYVGETALVHDGKEPLTRNASVKAIEKTICLVCDQATFRKVLGDRSNVKFANRKNYRAAVLTAIKDKEEDLGNVDRTKDQAKTDYLLEAVSYDMRKKKDDPVNTPDDIGQCEGANLMFKTLDEEQKRAVIAKMHREKVTKGTTLIKQGDEDASRFYVVDSGSFNFIVDGEQVGTCPAQCCFGELALMYDAPRAATVVAAEDSVVWVVTRHTFRTAVRNIHKGNSKQNMEFLRSVVLLKTLLSQELALIDAALEEKTYPKGHQLFKQGDRGDRFYIIKKGKVSGNKKNDDGTDEPISLVAGQFFGELALMDHPEDDEKHSDKRACTLSAESSKLVTLELSKYDFEELLGPLADLLASRARKSYIAAKDKPKAELRKDLKQKQLKQLGYLGRGAFGFVTLVQAPDGETYALKAVKKCQIVETGQQEHIKSEKRIMAMMQNPFLVNLVATFKDKLRVYFLLELCLGGELFTILRQRRYFDEPTSQFYAACVVEGFDYMHSMDIIYRDLKPENLVMAENGYLKITDFGFAKIVPEKTYTLCGTPDYLAPEIVTGQGHGKAVDWWTFGVLIYEMLASFPPFFDDDPIQTYRKIIKGRIKYPRYFSGEAKEIVGSLLKLKPTRRLGVIKGGPDNIRKHAWFRKFKWKEFQMQQLPPPIQPKVKSNTDASNFNRRAETDDDAKPIRPEDEFDEDF